ncbi:MAG: hypothetical protein PWP49_973 [Thermococcaceae archaeon]|nr:hypothetical protein [Thermococcaceae archaeon]
MGEIKLEWEKALEEKDCEKLLELFDDYIDSIEDEETLRKELERLKEVALQCEDPYDLAHEVAHVYSHLGDVEAGIELYKKLVEMKKDDPEEYATALYYLADAYEHFGMPDKAIETYEKLLELERELGNKKEEALTLAHIAINYDELEEIEKAIELMEKASVMFKELGDERNYLISLLDLAHFYYELGDYEKSEELLSEILKAPRDTEIEVNARIIEAEIKAAQEDFKGAFQSLKQALLKALEVDDEELFSIVFEAVYNFIMELFEEKMYKEVYENIGSLADAFEDINEEYEKFFTAVKELAKLKDGLDNEYDRVYGTISVDEFKELLDELKKIGTSVLSVRL